MNPRRGVWLPLVLLIISLLAFWVLPLQWKDKPVQVEFEGTRK